MANFSTRHVIKPKTRRDFPLGIVLICLLFLSFLLWNKWDKISNFFSGSDAISAIEDSGFVVGQPITLEGQISANGDFMTHTHTLATKSSGVFGLKSKTVNLNQYTGQINIEGTVAAESSGLVIVDVVSAMDLNPVVATGIVATGDLTTGAVATTGRITTDPVLPKDPSTSSVTTATPGEKKSLDVQAGITQFPITIGTGIVFTSSRGHSILFPSKKISFSSMTLATTDFGVKGLRCYSQINVVDYQNKANLSTAPSVKIFECTNKTTTVPSQFASVSLDDGRVFLIEATDPAWGSFANAIEISSIPTAQ